jgi:hypothetical protein
LPVCRACEGGKSGKIGGKNGKVRGKSGKVRGKNGKVRGKNGKGGKPSPLPASLTGKGPCGKMECRRREVVVFAGFPA